MLRARVRRDPRQLPKIVKKKRQQAQSPAGKKRPEAPETVSREQQTVLIPASRERQETLNRARKKRPEALRIASSAWQAAATEEPRAAAMEDLLRHRVPGETDETEELRAAGLTGRRIPVRAVI